MNIYFFLIRFMLYVYDLHAYPGLKGDFYGFYRFAKLVRKLWYKTTWSTSSADLSRYLCRPAGLLLAFCQNFGSAENRAERPRGRLMVGPVPTMDFQPLKRAI